jgi:hypothetical protein
VSAQGAGHPDLSYRFEYVLDPDDDNLASIGPYGLAVLMPRVQSHPPAALAQHDPEIELAVASGDRKTVDMTIEYYDTLSLHDDEVTPARYFFTESGIYAITGHVRWARADSGRRMIVLLQNGVGVLAKAQVVCPASAPNAVFQTVSTIGSFDRGWWTELAIEQASGAVLPLEVNANSYSASLSVCRLGHR